MSEPVRWRDFWGLHREGWGDRIVAEAFAHPAKIRPALAQKIVSHGIAEGWWTPGITILCDPFAGIGGCLLVAGFNGLASVGVELEPHFVDLCERNIALHDPIWGRDGCVRPVVVQGDSRELGRHVAAAMGSIASPPYASAIGSRDSAIDWEKANAARVEGPLRHPKTAPLKMVYGTTPSNLGNLPMGSVGSPPYADDAPGAGGLNTKPPREGTDDQSGRKAGPSQVGVGGCVGSPPHADTLQNPGGSRTPNAPDGFKLGRSTPGVGGSVASPPFQGAHGGAVDGTSMVPPKDSKGTLAGTIRADGYGSTPGQLGAMKAGSLASPPFEGVTGDRPSDVIRRDQSLGASNAGDGYGKTAGQLGNEKGTTFWDALRVIAGELHALLPEGAVSAWIVKDFVRDKQRVPFCDDCATLLEQAGFHVFERWRCWMRSPLGHADLFTGEFKPLTEHKGFFRRLAEAKGSPRIDFEEALWFRKPANGAADG